MLPGLGLWKGICGTKKIKNSKCPYRAGKQFMGAERTESASGFRALEGNLRN